MKKFVTLLALIIVAMISYSQDITRTIDFPVNGTYASYLGTAGDTLKDGSQDSIDFIFRYHSNLSVDKISIGFQVDTVSASDNGVVYSLYRKEFASDPTWVAIIAQDTTTDVNGLNKYYTATQATIATDKSFLHYRLRLFMEASSGTGDKLKLDKVEIKAYQK